MNILKLFKKKDKKPMCSAVILAAGQSERMNDDKMFMELGGMPVLARTLSAFQACELVDEIILVTRMEKVLEAAELCKKYNISKAAKVIRGGATRMESALAGVSETRRGAKLIAVHDGARPLVTQELISRTVYAARDHLAAAPALRSVDTLKALDDREYIIGTVDRERTARVQTPQVFDADIIKGALTKAAKDGLAFTDDCSAVEMMGFKVFTVEGDEDNLKLTTPRDAAIAAMILSGRGE